MIYILQKPLKDRNNKELRIISFFLDKTELKKKALGEPKQQLKLNYFTAINIHYIFMEKGDILFSQGDFADCFYLLFKGKLNVLKNNDYTIELTAEEYLNLLYNMQNRKIKERVFQTIKYNKNTFYVNDKDLSILNIHVFLTLLRRYISIKAPQKKIQNLFIKYGIDSSEFSINFNNLDNLIQRNDYLFNILEKIILRYFGTISFDFDVYWYVIDEKKEKVFIFDCHVVLNLNSGKVFGDMALDNKTNMR